MFCSLSENHSFRISLTNHDIITVLLGVWQLLFNAGFAPSPFSDFRPSASSQTRGGGTPGRHEPSLCRHKPPRFAKQAKPQLYSNQHAQYIKMCLCNTGGFLNLCLKVKWKIFLQIFRHSGMRGFSKMYQSS